MVRVWGNALNVEQMLVALSTENPPFADVLLKAAAKVTRDRLDALGFKKKKGSIILPTDKKFFIPKQ